MSTSVIPDMAPIFIKQYHKGSYHMALNSLPTDIKEISCNVKEFKHPFKNCPYLNNFYILKQCFQYCSMWYILFLACIVWYCLIEWCSRYKFNVEIKHCIVFCILFLTVIYDFSIFSFSMFTYRVCVCVRTRACMRACVCDVSYISGSRVYFL
jgi:hypothetical protein